MARGHFVRGGLALEAVDRRDLARLVGVAVAQALVTSAVALAIGRAFDLTLTSGSAQAGWRGSAPWIVGLFVGFAALMGCLRAAERVLSERCGQAVSHRLRLRLWDHLQHLPVGDVRGERHGAVMLRFLGDLNSLKSWVSRGLVGGAVAGATVVGALLALFWLNTRIALAVLICLVLALAIQVAMGGGLRGRQIALRRARTRLATDVMERVAALAVVQAFGQQRRERRRVRRGSRRLRREAESFARWSGLHQGFSEAAALVMMGVVLWIGFGASGASWLGGVPTAGDVAASLVLVRLVGRPLRRLARVHELWHRMVVGEEKLLQFFDLPAELRDARQARRLPEGPGTVKFRSVQVAGALHGVSAVAPSGSLVRIEGRNGSGKSTLLGVLAALRRPDEGRAVVDGRDLARCRLATLRSEIGVLSSELPLMRGTVRRNLTYRRPGASDAELKQVIERLELGPTIERLGGLGARVAEAGGNLSSGERQRLAMARAVLGGPRVLILDEPDAHLDRSSRAVLRRFLEAYEGTVLLVWHGEDPPLADRIWTLDEGRLVKRARPGRSTTRGELRLAGSEVT